MPRRNAVELFAFESPVNGALTVIWLQLSTVAVGSPGVTGATAALGVRPVVHGAVAAQFWQPS